MITSNHKIGEQFTYVTENSQAISLVIYRARDGKYFNLIGRNFEVFNPADNFMYYQIPLSPHISNPYLKRTDIDFLPRQPLDLIFELRDAQNTPIGYERHTFGGYGELNNPGICVIFGTLYTPSGTPLGGVRVDALLNKSGYYIDKHPVIAPTTSVITDDRGYFELPLIQGINVTINIAATGWTTSGYVPKQPSMELSGYCLLKEGM